MKTKRVLGIMALILLLCLSAYAGYRRHMLSRVNDFQTMQIMVDGKKYIHNGWSTEERPEGAPDGVITKVNDSTDYPDADGEANFGKVGMPYWQNGAQIIVESSRYYVFNAAG